MTTADITKLTVAEKLTLMEKLWDALREQADSSIVPVWHKDILAERLRRLDNGSEPVTHWAKAKEFIRAQAKAIDSHPANPSAESIQWVPDRV